MRPTFYLHLTSQETERSDSVLHGGEGGSWEWWVGGGPLAMLGTLVLHPSIGEEATRVRWPLDPPSPYLIKSQIVSVERDT